MTTKNGHPHLIWAPYPGTSTTQYKIYRLLGFSIWNYLGSSTGSTFTDVSIDDGFDSANYYEEWIYRITAVNSQNIESTPSNQVTAYVYWPQEFQKKNPDKSIEQAGLNEPEYYLCQNYPNPFNPSTTISYRIKEAGLVNITVYDVLGRNVKTLVNEFKAKGNYNITFNADKLAGGIYFYRIIVNNYVQMNKMNLLK